MPHADSHELRWRPDSSSNSYEGTQHDAVLLAVSIYLDIFNLFLAILRLLGILKGSVE